MLTNLLASSARRCAARREVDSAAAAAGPSFRRSEEAFARASRVIPGGSQTLSKRPSAFAPGRFPRLLERGRGARVWDVDGNAYVDYVMAMGPITLGYAHPRVDAAITRQLADGIVFSLPHPLEAQVAERVRSLVPCAEMVRFLKGGAEATSAAVRLARAFTGRDRVLHNGYHGWQDWYRASDPRAVGVPRALGGLIESFPYNDVGALAARIDAGELPAAVIMEPCLQHLPQPGFLEAVRDLTAQRGVPLIFDEVVTGFRVHSGGAQAYYRVVPDLACFAKGIANGMPLAAVAGRADVMSVAERAMISVTYGGECLSLAAAAATLDELVEADAIGHIWRAGEALMRTLDRAARDAGVAARCTGLPCFPTLHLDVPPDLQQDAWTVVLAETAARGVLFRRGGLSLLSAAHTAQDIAQTGEAFVAALSRLKGALDAGTLAAQAGRAQAEQGIR